MLAHVLEVMAKLDILNHMCSVLVAPGECLEFLAGVGERRAVCEGRNIVLGDLIVLIAV